MTDIRLKYKLGLLPNSTDVTVDGPNSESWNTTNSSQQTISKTLKLDLVDLNGAGSTIKYSRASGNTGNQQFYISGKYQNNITWGTAASPINGRPNDRDIPEFVYETSPTAAQLWWDFTCEFRDSIALILQCLTKVVETLNFHQRLKQQVLIMKLHMIILFL